MGGVFAVGKMSTAITRAFRDRFHNDPVLFSVSEKDTKPRSDTHAKRMTDDQKKAMARRGKELTAKNNAIKEKLANDEKIRKEYEKRVVQYETDRKNAADKINKEREAAAKSGMVFKEAEDDILLVIRVKGTNKMAPKPKKIMALLNLRKINSAVFLKVNKSVMNMLKHVNPWVTFGKPTTETIRALLLKRGHGRIGRRGHWDRVRITDNALISRELGNIGIHGFEDLIAAIESGENYRDFKKFLAPFYLNSPTKGYGGTKKHMFSEYRGGATGYRGEFINQLALKMI